MQASRSASPDVLLRKALDAYMPIYEIEAANADPEIQQLATEAAAIVGKDAVRRALRECLDRTMRLPLQATGTEGGR